MTDENGGNERSSGWDAIEQALVAIYGEQEPMHVGTVIKYMLGGPDPIDGVSVYRSEKGGPHWHYVTFGFSELYEKESDDPEYSGFGFELTMRLNRAGEDAPPMWPVSLMQNLARYVFSSGQAFAAGHYLDCNGPVCLDAETKLQALIFVEDSELKSIDTPHGKVNFLQMVAITADELNAAKRWNTVGFSRLLEERYPFLIVDLARESIMADAAVSKKVDEGISKDGSSTGSLFVTQLDCKIGLLGKCQLIFGAHAIPEIQALLPSRINHGRELFLAGDKSAIRIVPGEKFSYKKNDDVLVLTLTAEDASALTRSLQPREGEYKIRNDFSVKVLKTEIKNADGKVVQVVG